MVPQYSELGYKCVPRDKSEKTIKITFLLKCRNISFIFGMLSFYLSPVLCFYRELQAV